MIKTKDSSPSLQTTNDIANSKNVKGPTIIHDQGRPESNIKTISGPVCEKHHIPENMYCDVCQTILCPACFATKHKYHRVTDIEDKAASIKRDIKIKIGNMQSEERDINKKIDKMNDIATDVNTITSKALEDVIENETELKNRLEEILKEAAEKSEAHKATIESRKKEELDKIKTIQDELISRKSELALNLHKANQLLATSEAHDVVGKRESITTHSNTYRDETVSSYEIPKFSSEKLEVNSEAFGQISYQRKTSPDDVPDTDSSDEEEKLDYAGGGISEESAWPVKARKQIPSYAHRSMSLKASGYNVSSDGGQQRLFCTAANGGELVCYKINGTIEWRDTLLNEGDGVLWGFLERNLPWTSNANILRAILCVGNYLVVCYSRFIQLRILFNGRIMDKKSVNTYLGPDEYTYKGNQRVKIPKSFSGGMCEISSKTFLVSSYDEKSHSKMIEIEIMYLDLGYDWHCGLNPSEQRTISVPLPCIAAAAFDSHKEQRILIALSERKRMVAMDYDKKTPLWTLSSITYLGKHVNALGICADDSGHLFVTDKLNGRVLVMDIQTHSMLNTIVDCDAWPMHLTWMGGEKTLILSTQRGFVQLYKILYSDSP